MSDPRALLAHRSVPVATMLYAERKVLRDNAMEAFLREWLARLTPRLPALEKRFCRQVASAGQTVAELSDIELRQALRALGAALRKDGLITRHLVHSFALIREASRRTLGKRHHDVQLIAARALLRGRIAEMATGEGKTLCGTLAACTVAASGACVHVVTVNDYLAQRDAEELAPLFDFFGLTTGLIQQGMPPNEREVQYDKDIVFVSNKELTFDYLKDCLRVPARSATRLALERLTAGRRTRASLLRGLHFALIDEADSVLIDEARTPLIISSTRADATDDRLYREALGLAAELQAETHFILRPNRDLWLTPTGEARARELADSRPPPWKSALWRREFLQKALLALHAYHRDRDYIVADGKVQIIDEFTGRAMPDRSWEGGLHQMIETREGVELTGARVTLAQITYQRFFSRYLLTAGMTGTAREIEGELSRVYDLRVSPIPSHKPSQRRHLAPSVLPTSEARWRRVAQRAREEAERGRAVLIGTRSIEASETLSGELRAMEIAHAVLNARQDQTEAQTIAQAGTPGRITVATNMAGRGTDIKLHPEVERAGGLHVILTEFNESPRIDRQLFGRAARQGDPGSVEAIVSLEDELFATEAPWCSRFATFLTRESRLSRLTFGVLRRACQLTRGWKLRRIRLETLKRDRQWQESLGFVHPRRK